MKVNESEPEFRHDGSKQNCVCGHWDAELPDRCQCQYMDWPSNSYKCDFCGKLPVAKELVIHTMPWAICRVCWDMHHHAIALVQARGEEE